ncbi:MAG: hypothetical protein Q4B34_00700 [Candidatus Saccharibacteria bacterium]|nr:hypothetical protein [Candidatus Saccharibacteria bacterium]
MKYLVEDFKRIYKTEHFMLALMILNLIASIILIVVSIVNLNPESSTIKVGYGDIGGYRDGAWSDFLAFTVLGIILGVFHNIVAINVFHKRGAGITKFFLLTTSALIAGAFVVLLRLLGVV